MDNQDGADRQKAVGGRAEGPAAHSAGLRVDASRAALGAGNRVKGTARQAPERGRAGAAGAAEPDMRPSGRGKGGLATRRMGEPMDLGPDEAPGGGMERHGTQRTGGTWESLEVQAALEPSRKASRTAIGGYGEREGPGRAPPSGGGDYWARCGSAWPPLALRPRGQGQGGLLARRIGEATNPGPVEDSAPVAHGCDNALQTPQWLHAVAPAPADSAEEETRAWAVRGCPPTVGPASVATGGDAPRGRLAAGGRGGIDPWSGGRDPWSGATGPTPGAEAGAAGLPPEDERDGVPPPLPPPPSSPCSGTEAAGDLGGLRGAGADRDEGRGNATDAHSAMGQASGAPEGTGIGTAHAPAQQAGTEARAPAFWIGEDDDLPPPGLVDSSDAGNESDGRPNVADSSGSEVDDDGEGPPLRRCGPILRPSRVACVEGLDARERSRLIHELTDEIRGRAASGRVTEGRWSRAFVPLIWLSCEQHRRALLAGLLPLGIDIRPVRQFGRYLRRQGVRTVSDTAEWLQDLVRTRR